MPIISITYCTVCCQVGPYIFSLFCSEPLELDTHCPPHWIPQCWPPTLGGLHFLSSFQLPQREKEAIASSDITKAPIVAWRNQPTEKPKSVIGG